MVNINTPEGAKPDPICIVQVIGTRGKLTRREAKCAARLWKQMIETTSPGTLKPPKAVSH
jgi:hypothetical protein